VTPGETSSARNIAEVNLRDGRAGNASDGAVVTHLLLLRRWDDAYTNVVYEGMLDGMPPEERRLIDDLLVMAALADDE
jgi:hypothetical protein